MRDMRDYLVRGKQARHRSVVRGMHRGRRTSGPIRWRKSRRLPTRGGSLNNRPTPAGSAIPNAARRTFDPFNLSCYILSCIATNARQARCHLDPEITPEFSPFIKLLQVSGVGQPYAAKGDPGSRARFWKRELKQGAECQSNPSLGPRAFCSLMKRFPPQKRH